MKSGDKLTIKDGYPTKVSHQKKKVIAKPGDVVTVIADHVDVAIVESNNGERFSIHKSYLK